MKLILISIVLLGLAGFAVAQANFNYLTYTHESAMAMHQMFEYSASYYQSYLSSEAESLSDLLMETAIARLETATNPAVGAAIQECLGMAYYSTNNLVTNVNYYLQQVHKESNDLHQVVNEELLVTNLMRINFDNFYYAVTVRMYEKYDHINDVLLQEVIDHLVELVVNYYVVSIELERCLTAA